jgi:hypothetical protein
MSELVRLYTEATKFAMSQNQTVGEKNDYFITLAQLQALIFKQQQSQGQ